MSGSFTTCVSADYGIDPHYVGKGNGNESSSANVTKHVAKTIGCEVQTP